MSITAADWLKPIKASSLGLDLLSVAAACRGVQAGSAAFEQQMSEDDGDERFRRYPKGCFFG
jgi:hypothetical protein